ncbi:MAG: GNAT family N-acetyltransferase [Myxococcota bacterium]
MSYRLVFERVREEHIGPYVELSRTEYAGQPASQPAHLRWKHLENPQGASSAYHLYDGETLVGRICLQLRDFVLGGRKLRAGYLTDLLIHPQHRGMKTFLQLMRDIRSVPAVDLLYVTPNATSSPLYTGVLRFRRSHRMSVQAAPVRARRLLEHVFSVRSRLVAAVVDGLLRLVIVALGLLAWRPRRPLRITRTRPPDTDLESLLRESSRIENLEGERGPAFHAWRFHESPVHTYRTAYVHDGSQLVAYLVTRVAEYAGYRTLFVIDVRLHPGLGWRDRLHLRSWLLGRARHEGCDLALGIFMRENPGLGRFCRLPFVRVPVRLLPQPVDLFLVDLGSADVLPADPDRYPFTLADLDVF